MKMPDLYQALQALLARQHQARYRALIISAVDQPTLLSISRVLRELRPHDLFWSEPGQAQAPRVPCAWSEFVDRVIRPISPDLILHGPDTWLSDWPPLEQSNFWSQLAASFGRRRVIALLAESPARVAQFVPYFTADIVLAPGLRGWRSRLEQPFSESSL